MDKTKVEFGASSSGKIFSHKKKVATKELHHKSRAAERRSCNLVFLR